MGINSKKWENREKGFIPVKQFELGSGLFENMPDDKTVTYTNVEFPGMLGKVTEKEKFTAAKQILLGLGILYVFTIMAYLLRPEASKLLDIITVTFPPIATLILAAYFRDKNH